ncbi:WhiB family transcriptional regulator [Nocardia jejuensis]|uniref:WhiB family transcriptional regulator n=1 Tax=Nocardia jejuensis TaxID=328049 RepID=UPI000A01E7EB|nr:WhiB family transcriptional regulator [Nocardia jejuensis]
MSVAVRGDHGIADDTRWQDSGSCRGMDSAMFFHPDGERGRARVDRVRRAKQICRSCQVVDRCLSYALATEQPFGIWGGMSEQERHDLLGKKPGSAAKTVSRHQRRCDARRGVC